MKFTVLFASLAATVVSALPAGNATIQSLETRAGCRSSTLTWNVYATSTPNKVRNVFDLQLDNNQSLGSFSLEWDPTLSIYGCKMNSSNQVVYCVTIWGYMMSAAVQITHKGDIYYHDKQNDALGVPAGGLRKTYQYWDCITNV
ncbi:hypothetical protein BGZ95_009912 [Linnemannia exigua]|uniref:Uncharacterized protein n=1 Tax=Linnemannia exigua TaxID=604196 RepID=A0AAD4DE82_9FUNG|nr:hypothetical protein BGZ95_009912 [Linnemannia exigua]